MKIGTLFLSFATIYTSNLIKNYFVLKKRIKNIKKQKETPAYYDIIVYDIVNGSNGEGEDSICWL